jgi:hypothetical protein
VQSFEAKLARATVEAARRALQKTRGKQLYAFALYTSGQDDFGYVCVSANTEEALTRKAAGAGTAIRDLRFNAPDWELHDFDKDVRAIELPPRGTRKRDALVYKALVAALKAVDQKRVFGTGKRRNEVMLAVMCGDMDERFLLKGMRALNPPAVVRAYRERFTPKPFLDRLRALPDATRTATVITLWEDLGLDRDTPLAREAAEFGATQWDVHAVVKELGTAAIEPLLALIEVHADGKAWNRKGTPAYAKHGVSGLGISLATSAVFMIGELNGNVPESVIPRLQACLRRRLAADDKMKGPVPTLAENIARVMHELQPQRFPDTQMGYDSNRLENPKPFLR